MMRTHLSEWMFAMESWNHRLFAVINSPSPFVDAHLHGVVPFLANGLVWLLPVLLTAIWLRGDQEGISAAVRAGLSALIALSIAAAIGWLWPHPRPFVMHMGRLLVAHAPDASLPSDHLTFWWSITLALAWTRRYHRLGLALAVLGLTIAWARIYAGVHFPADMTAAFSVSLIAVQIARYCLWPVERPLTRFALWLRRRVALNAYWAEGGSRRTNSGEQ